MDQQSITASQFPQMVSPHEENNKFLRQVQADQEQQIQLEMLTEECEQLINKIFSTSIQVQQSFISQQSQQPSLRQDKSRLEKEFLDLCIEIERQQKQLENYKFKIKVANKEAEYYTRQIKEKQEILKNLEKHHEEHSGRRKIFNRK